MKSDMNVNDLARAVDTMSREKRDFVVDTRKVEAHSCASGIEFRFPEVSGNNMFFVNDHALTQTQARLKIDATYFRRLREKHPALLAHNIDYLFHAEPEKRMFRCLEGRGYAPHARAVVSDSFKRTDNEHILRVAIPIFRTHPELVFQSTALTPLKMHIKATLPTQRREVKVGDIVEIGLGLANSEVGVGAIDVYPFAYRLICKNGARIDVAAMRKRHLGRKITEEGEAALAYKKDTLAADDKLLALQIRDTIEAILDGNVLDKAVNKMKEALDDRMTGNITEAVVELAKAESFTSAESDAILQHLIRGGDLSRYGLMNAVTAAANEASDYERATWLEATGGKILDLNKSEWERINV